MISLFTALLAARLDGMPLKPAVDATVHKACLARCTWPGDHGWGGTRCYASAAPPVVGRRREGGFTAEWLMGVGVEARGLLMML